MGKIEFFGELIVTYMLKPAGITTLGLYRTGGVNSKVQRLMTSVFGELRPVIPVHREDLFHSKDYQVYLKVCYSQLLQLPLTCSWRQMPGTPRP